MITIFGIALNMGISAWIATIISSLGFIIMFGIASSKGDYQGLIKTTLSNDELTRKLRKTKKDNKNN